MERIGGSECADRGLAHTWLRGELLKQILEVLISAIGLACLQLLLCFLGLAFLL